MRKHNEQLVRKRKLSITQVTSDMIHYLRIENAEGYVLIALYLFICMRVIRITHKVLNRIA